MYFLFSGRAGFKILSLISLCIHFVGLDCKSNPGKLINDCVTSQYCPFMNPKTSEIPWNTVWIKISNSTKGLKISLKACITHFVIFIVIQDGLIPDSMKKTADPDLTKFIYLFYIFASHPLHHPFNVPMKWKITYAYLRGLSKRTRMAFSFFEYLLSFQRYSSFCSKIDDVTNCISTKITDHKIRNISGNIGMMLLKLGTGNVPSERHKMTPTVPSPWQQFCFRVHFMLDWHSHFLS